MPVADYGQYCEMLDRARKGKFAYPAINVTSLATANAVLKGARATGSSRSRPEEAPSRRAPS
jgi:fructose-bisphosphate aldolase class II